MVRGDTEFSSEETAYQCRALAAPTEGEDLDPTW